MTPYPRGIRAPEEQRATQPQRPASRAPRVSYTRPTGASLLGPIHSLIS